MMFVHYYDKLVEGRYVTTGLFGKSGLFKIEPDKFTKNATGWHNNFECFI